MRCEMCLKEKNSEDFIYDGVCYVCKEEHIKKKVDEIMKHQTHTEEERIFLYSASCFMRHMELRRFKISAANVERALRDP